VAEQARPAMARAARVWCGTGEGEGLTGRSGWCGVVDRSSVAHWACPGRGERTRPTPNSAIFHFFKMLELIWSKNVLPVLENFQIKYGFEDFGIRNNFAYWKFSKFGTKFELKTWEASRVWIWIEFDEILIQTPEFDDIWTRNSCLHMDDRSLVKKVWNSKFMSLLSCFKNLIWILTLATLELD
jgi:hypothetical protein